MNHLAHLDRDALRAGLDAARADGWLLFEFKGSNPISLRMLGLTHAGTRRLFVYLPRDGHPVAVAHRIELQPLAGFPGTVIPYSRWQELHDALRRLVDGKTVAMEISPDDAVPYLDRVPFGVVQLVQRLGGAVVSSGPLVTRFTARWTPAEAANHVAAAEILARVAKRILGEVVSRGGTGLSETAVQRQVVQELATDGVVVDPGHLPIVAFGPNAANPHYAPLEGSDRFLGGDEVVLLDLFGGMSLDTVFADQTWMGWSGASPPDEVTSVWEVVRAARDAAIREVRTAAAEKRVIRGFEIDRAARAVVEAAGYAAHFVHRTGHSIDRELHGSGPNCDDYETHDDRTLMAGVGFSIEPGVYLTDRFGIRSEVNLYWSPDGPVVTPVEPQRDLITTGG